MWTQFDNKKKSLGLERINGVEHEYLCVCAWAGGRLVSGPPRNLAPSVLNWRCFHCVPLAEPFYSYQLKAPRDRMRAKLGRRELVWFQRYASEALPDQAVESFGGTFIYISRDGTSYREPLLYSFISSHLSVPQSSGKYPWNIYHTSKPHLALCHSCCPSFSLNMSLPVPNWLMKNQQAIAKGAKGF